MKWIASLVALIEWYDAAICINFGQLLLQVFTNIEDKEKIFIIYFYLIAINQICRPIGAYLFGKYSDQKSRLNATKLAFILMVGTSFILSLLPSCKTIGITATFVFFLVRILQGIALGGNYATSVFSIEQSKGQKNFIASLVSTSIIGGFLLGTIFTNVIQYLSTELFINTYGWRIALMGSSILAIPVLLYLKNSKEIKVEKIENKIEHKQLKLSYKSFFLTCIILLMDMIPFYIFFNFLPNYKTTFMNYENSVVTYNNTVSLLITMFLTPFFGKCADKIGPKFILYATTLGLIVIGLYFPWDGIFWNIILGIIMAGCYGSLYGWLATKFPNNIRAKASGLALNLTATLTNLTIAFLAQFFIHHANYIGLFLSSISILILIALWLEDEY